MKSCNTFQTSICVSFINLGFATTCLNEHVWQPETLNSHTIGGWPGFEKSPSWWGRGNWGQNSSRWTQRGCILFLAGGGTKMGHYLSESNSWRVECQTVGLKMRCARSPIEMIFSDLVKFGDKERYMKVVWPHVAAKVIQN